MAWRYALLVMFVHFSLEVIPVGPFNHVKSINS